MRNTILLLTLLPLLLLQSEGKTPATMLYERGRIALDRGSKQDAARHLRQARQLCLRDATNADSAGILALIAETLPKADPLAKDRDKTMKSVARSLVAIAARYQKKGWADTAESYLLTAQSLDPSVGAKERKKLRATRQSTTKMPEIYSFFPDLKSVWDLQGWKRKANGIYAPQSNKDESTAILHPQALATGYRVTVEIEIPDGRSRGGIYFAYKTRQEFHYLELSYDEEGVLFLELYLRAHQQFQKLETFVIDEKLVAGKRWIPLILEVRKGEVAFAIEGRPLWASPQPDRSLSGKIGLSATCLPESVGSIGFRSFVYEALAQ